MIVTVSSEVTKNVSLIRKLEAFSPGPYRLRKNALYEGHGFSRAALSYHLRALAPEVRLLRPDALKSVPQRLKPRREHGTCGTAEAVPFVEAFFRSRKARKLQHKAFSRF